MKIRGGWVGATLAFVLAVACASSGGEGSETHFVCSSDAQCEARGEGVCVEKRCVVTDSGAGGTGDGSGGANSGAGAAIIDLGGAPPVLAPEMCPAGAPFDGLTYGCHMSRHAGAVCRGRGDMVGTCPGVGGDRPPPAVGLPSELPCGACTGTGRCSASIARLCDCDGDGPEPAFVYDAGEQGFSDEWLCQCNANQWECLMTSVSASDPCINVCPRQRDAQ